MTGPSEAGVQRLLRPDQAAAALVMSQAGSSPERIAEALAVPVKLVERSLRLPAVPAPVPEPLEPRVLGRVLRVGERLAVRRLPRPARWRAPNYIEDDLAWPAPVSPEDRWRVMPVSEGRTVERVALREVALWGERVLVDERRRVFCPDCCQLLHAVELGRNLFQGQDDLMGGGIPSHRLGLPPLRPVSA
jgi:hypothetical protein